MDQVAAPPLAPAPASWYAALGGGHALRLTGVARWAQGTVAVALTIFVVWYALFAPVDGHLLGAVMVFAVLPLLLITNSASLRTYRRLWIDYVLAAAALVVGFYFLVNNKYYANFVDGLTGIPTIEKIAGLAIVVLSIEAARRCVGWGLTYIVLALLAYVVLGPLLPTPLHHKGVSLDYFITMMSIGTTGIFGEAVSVAGSYVFLFILFGSLYHRTGGGQLFFDLAAALTGRTTGGAAKTCVMASGLYGSVSGSPVADVVTTGPFTIPLMQKTGVSGERAGAIECAASCGGAMLPPVMGAVAFLMVEYTSIPYSTIALASLPSALLYYVAILLFVHLEAQQRGHGSIGADVMVSLGVALRRGWPNLLPLAAMVTLLVMDFSVPFVAAGSALAAIVSSWINPDPSLRLTPMRLIDACAETLQRLSGLLAAVLAAGVILGCIELTGLSGKFSLMMSMAAGGSLIIALLVAAVILVLLGLGLPTPGVYIMGVALIAPVLVTQFKLGVMETHMFMLYLACMSAITPPVAAACFAAATIANANPMAIGWQSCKIAIAGFALPFFFVFNPGLLTIGGTAQIAGHIVAATAFVGVLIVAIQGSLAGRALSLPVRMVLFATACLALWPQPYVQAVVVALALGLVGVAHTRRRRAKPLAA